MNAPARRRLPAAERARQVLDAAEQLFIEQGYEPTTIDQIAKAAGVTRPTVYQHHPSKESMYLACVARARAEFRERTIAALVGVHDPREQIRTVVDVYLSIIEGDPAKWGLVWGGGAVALSGEVGERLTELRFETVGDLAALIRAQAPDLDPEWVQVVAHSMSGIAEQLGRWWLRNPDIPRQRVVRQFVEFVWNGLNPQVAARR